MCHLDTAQCRILKDLGRFLVKLPRGLGLMDCLKTMTCTLKHHYNVDIVQFSIMSIGEVNIVGSCSL